MDTTEETVPQSNQKDNEGFETIQEDPAQEVADFEMEKENSKNTSKSLSTDEKDRFNLNQGSKELRNEAVVVKNADRKSTVEESSERTKSSNLVDPTPLEISKGVVAENSEPKLEEPKESARKGTMNLEVDDKEAVAKNEEGQKKKISIYDAIEEQKELEKDALADNSTEGRWSMGPSVAPVFFSSLGEGSPIHSNFASNSKSGKLNLSYGLNISYQVTDKLSIRSGIHKVDFGYDTNDVVFTSSLTTSTNELIDNINYAQTSGNLVVTSKNSNNDALSDNPEVAGEVSPFEGRMVQQLGYVEVPMELNYALLDRKFGVNIIGGVSSLFLVDNAVSLESDQLITEMGEANNANDVNFSTNIGIGLNYEISPKLQLNVEPMFKYQLNTFSETAGNFRPYSVGVYSGLNFRF